MKKDFENIKGHVPKIIGQDDFYKAAVCITLLEADTDYDVLFEVRSNNISQQPQDVCFPGGKLKMGESYKDAAIRETCEELLICPEQIEIICESDYIHFANTIIFPFAAIIKEYNNSFNKDEVAKVFKVPLSFFIDTKPKRYVIDSKVIPGDDFPYHLINGGKDYKWRSRKTEELFYEFEGHVIWGLTASMLHAFCKLIKDL